MNIPVKRVAAVHDLSGFGRISLAAVIPILSTMGLQVCSLPTAILSTPTGGFKDYKFIDLTKHMDGYINHWKKLSLKFEGIYTGFLGSSHQIDIISKFIKEFSKEDSLVVIDPVMGDDGKLYGTMNDKMVQKMRKYISFAHIITPNFTEAAYLLNRPYRLNISEKEIKSWLMDLSKMGPQIVIITSVPDSGLSKNTSVIAYNKKDGRFWKVKCEYIPAYYPGAGDIFTSVITGSILQGDSLPIALDRGVQFITAGIRASYGYSYPQREGIVLEKILPNLNAPVIISSYEIL
ncbi:MAG: pyridoxamine kinase [Candidatus Caldatribacteriota bacterium]|nr:pyridoxamine kinase [Candidatus Caldatribacteriota bacterium]